MTAPGVSTCLWFDTEAEAAARLYCSLIVDARILQVQPQGGPVLIVEFEMSGQRYTALNGGPTFTLSPAASVVIHVDTQAEVDRLWSALLEGGGAEIQCGWLTDRFGLSWQIVPRALPRLLWSDKSGRVMKAMLGMVKFDIAGLEAAARD